MKLLFSKLRYIASFIIIPSLFLVATAQTQSSGNKRVQISIEDFITFKGAFFDEFERSMIEHPHISVAIEGTDIKGETDKDGTFELIFPSSVIDKDSITLLIKFFPTDNRIHKMKTSDIKELKPNETLIIPISPHKVVIGS